MEHPVYVKILYRDAQHKSAKSLFKTFLPNFNIKKARDHWCLGGAACISDSLAKMEIILNCGFTKGQVYNTIYYFINTVIKYILRFENPTNNKIYYL